MNDLISFFQNNWPYIVACLYGVELALAEIPAIKANSTFQLVVNVTKKLAGK